MQRMRAKMRGRGHRKRNTNGKRWVAEAGEEGDQERDTPENEYWRIE